NVWLAQDGTARIGDFGLAIALDRSRITQEGVLVGTVAYMPPEQAMGRPPDARSDLYAVGAMLYEMVTGRTPFLGDDVVAIISQHVNTPPVAPSWHNSKVPSALEALILQLLEKDPQKRPQSAAAVTEALDRVNVSSPSTEAPVPALEPKGRAAWGRFVGRREELGQLKQALEDALSGRGSLVMLVGEPGIGKTRTAEEFGVHARLRGAQVLTGRSYEGDVEVPYFPFIEAFRQYVRARPDAELRQELGSGAPEVASLVSEVRERFPDIPQSAALEGEAERLRLFDSVAAFLRNASAATPLVLHLDDLHWADKPSLLLLRYLARTVGSERIVVVGTYRDVELDRNHPLSEVLGELRREPVFRRILLRGLPDEDVMAFLMALADDEPDEETLAARQALAEVLHRETEGNPFFLGEVLSHLVESGKIVWEGGRWQSSVASITDLGIPEGVREVVGRRLSNLSDACNRMLTVASAMPAGFSWESVSAVSEDDEATLLDALDEALASRLIAERKDERTATYEFSHALVRQTLYEELSAPRRVLLHRRIGEALESLFGDNPGPQLAELAHHFFQAAPGGDVHKAIDYAVRAGERSASSAAYAEAIAHYERAVQAFELLAADDPERRCDVLLALAQAHNRSGTSDGARQAAIEAGDLARSTGDAERLALAALFQFSEFAVDLLEVERRVELLEEAHDALGPEDRPSRVRLLARLALEFSTTEIQRSRTFSREAVAVARRLDDPEALAIALNAKHASLFGADHLEERLRLSEELGRVASDAGRSDIEFQAHYSEVFDRLEMGDAAGARHAFEAHESLAQHTREPVGLWQVAVLRCMFVLLEGHFEEAERHAQAALDLAQRFQNDGGMIMYSIQISRVRSEQGRLEELEAVMRERLERNPHVGWQSRIAQIYAETDRLEECRREFESIAKHDFADIGSDIGWLLTMGYLAEACAYLGDERRAQLLYELLLPHANRNIVVLAAAVNGSVSRPLGILATALGRFDAAIAHLQEAQAMNERMGAPSLAARVQHDQAQTLLARGAPGDREAALALANRALQTAQELGMQMLVRNCLTTKLKAQGIDSSETQHSIYAVVAAVQKRPPDLDFSTAPDGTVTLMFSDMVDFTRMTEQLGDERAHQVVQVH
ncbi:MAG: AAA family ATPase, partial [Planctomycetota bacterium]